MAFSISTLVSAAFGRPPKLVCTSAVWRNGVLELRRRAAGVRESGAFLLGRKGRATHRIERFVYYDDMDPTCFRNGIVEFDGRKLGAVWRLCRDFDLDVVADVHVHPGGHGQSSSDQANPIMAEVGHLALILPDFATRRVNPGGIGIYQYLGSRRWTDLSTSGSRAFHVGWWPL